MLDKIAQGCRRKISCTLVLERKTPAGARLSTSLVLDCTAVPTTVWQTIKNNIDYTSFKNSAIQVLNNNFTSAQMQQTITDYQDKPYIPILHFKLREELQLAGLEFDIVLLAQINTILVANGYQSITL